MKRCTLLMILGALLLSSCSSAPIPQRTMMNIYYDMFTVDEVIREWPDALAAADSMSVYGAIFDRYGYTVEDYLSAVDFYLRKPELFARMMKKVQTRINKEIAELEKQAADTEETEQETDSATDSQSFR